MAARNRRMPPSEPDPEEANKKERAIRIEKITAKIHALIWMVLAALLGYFTDLSTLIFSDKLNRLWLNVFLVCFTAIVVIFLYLCIWLPWIMKITAPWSVYCPKMIHAAAGLSVAGFISLVVAFWSVWGFLSPLFVTFLSMGLLFSAHFIPWPF